MMKEIEDNIVSLKDMTEKIKDSQRLTDYVGMQNDMLEKIIETIELFYKLVTQ